MSVAVMLGDKGREVFTVAQSSTLGDVARMLAEKSIGALPVMDAKGTMCGIISERDIIRNFAKTGAVCFDQPVADFMTKNVKSCTEHDSLNNVMSRMTAGKFRHMPVLDGKTLIGLISVGDVIKQRLLQVEREAADIKSYLDGSIA